MLPGEIAFHGGIRTWASSRGLCPKDYVSACGYLFKAASTAETRPPESGSTSGSNRWITLPLRSTRNLVKFHWISPPVLGLVLASVRNWYRGALSAPFTEILENIGKVTPNFDL